MTRSVATTTETEADWQALYRRSYTDPQALLTALDLPMTLLPAARRAAALFPLRAPPGFVARMRRGDVNDPLLRQVLPLGDEELPATGFVPDPVGDLEAMPLPGVLHKYHGRVLLIMTGACAINCRYCFRRHFPYAESQLSQGQWREALDYLASSNDVSEVILSGGDPLLLPDEKLAARLQDLAALPGLKRLRIHSRLPVVLPERMTPALTGMLRDSRLQAVLVLHANHPRELDTSVAAALEGLRKAGLTLLNQAVLLRGINDNAATQRALSERLFEIGVLPYYLHTLDPVAGAAHFDTAERIALELIAILRTQLPGYLVPRLVREDPGAPGKTPL